LQPEQTREKEAPQRACDSRGTEQKRVVDKQVIANSAAVLREVIDMECRELLAFEFKIQALLAEQLSALSSPSFNQKNSQV
jgi:hypothetical protein